jgi:hypothetical protein
MDVVIEVRDKLVLMMDIEKNHCHNELLCCRCEMI